MNNTVMENFTYVAQKQKIREEMRQQRALLSAEYIAQAHASMAENFAKFIQQHEIKIIAAYYPYDTVLLYGDATVLSYRGEDRGIHDFEAKKWIPRSSRGMTTEALIPITSHLHATTPYDTEIDVLGILKAAKVKTPIALPCIMENDHLVFRLYDKNSSLIKGKYGIMEPYGTEIIQPDFVIAPLIAADKNFVRLGKGGGYYDRFFALHPNIFSIGFAYHCQILPQLPTEEHDRALDAIITPTEILTKFLNK